MNCNISCHPKDICKIVIEIHSKVHCQQSNILRRSYCQTNNFYLDLIASKMHFPHSAFYLLLIAVQSNVFVFKLCLLETQFHKTTFGMIFLKKCNCISKQLSFLSDFPLILHTIDCSRNVYLTLIVKYHILEFKTYILYCKNATCIKS